MSDQDHQRRERPEQAHAHWRCDCVPDLGPAHCHRCSRLQGGAIPWDKAPCAPYVEGALAAAENALAIRPRLSSEALADETAALVLDLLLIGREPKAEKAKAPEPEAQQKAQRVPTPKPPTERLIRVEDRPEDPNEPPSPWRVTELARGQAEALGITPRELVEAAESATVRHQTARGGVSHHADGLLILVDEGGECVISVIEKNDDDEWNTGDFAPRGQTQQAQQVQHKTKGVPRAKGGGPGRRMPSSTSELLAMAKEHGLSASMQGSGHWLLVLEGETHGVTVPATASDRRSYQNSISEIKRVTGIDIRLEP